MKARVLPLDTVEHRAAQELLPWFVNETLDTAERVQVAAHMAHCTRCQADAASQAELRAMAIDAEPGGSVERDWAVLRSRLNALPAAPNRSVATTRPWWKHGLQVAVALQAVVMLVLAVALVGVPSRTEPYRALGVAPAAPEANALAVFRSNATEQEMREALDAAGARIVGGPTVTHAYLLRLTDLGPDVLARLRSRPGVLSVESLEGDAPR